ncbi:MAG: MFS transporter [Candidatus Dormibacteraeota bacterium]|nr:MFS transporter [Candidatus Dormibacteraeota bacterium]MBO0744637.1 MFS transporter [Candidatus Dormibacteraeota bacterium]
MTASPDRDSRSKPERGDGLPFGILTLRDPRLPFSRLATAFMVSSVGDPFSLAISLIVVFSAFHSVFAIAVAYGVRAVAALLVGGLAGSVTDRVDRRRLLVLLDSGRFVILMVLPFLVTPFPIAVFPALLLLGGAEALAQPARLAGAVVLAPPGAVGRANSLLMVAYSVAQAIGYGLAGLAITTLAHPVDVYWIDAVTFLCSALLVLSLPNLGGGVTTTPFQLKAFQQIGRASLRPVLLATGGANLMVGVGTACILPLAYLLAARHPAAVYTWLQVALIAGLIAGSVALARGEARRPALAMAGGMALFGAGALGIAASPWIAVTLIAFAVTGVANAVYSVQSRTALMRRAPDDEQGSVMATRYSIAQVSQIIGFGLGALVAAAATARGAFLLVGAGMLAFAVLLTLELRRRQHAAGAVAPEP